MLKHKRKRFSGDRAKQSEAVHFPFNARLKCEKAWQVERLGVDLSNILFLLGKVSIHKL